MKPPPYDLANHMGVAPFVDRFYVDQPSVPCTLPLKGSADGFRGVGHVGLWFLLTGRGR